LVCNGRFESKGITGGANREGPQTPRPDLQNGQVKVRNGGITRRRCILADPGQRVMDRNANAAQMVGVADAGELQNMRRADGAPREDYLASRIDPLDPVATGIFNTDRSQPAASCVARTGRTPPSLGSLALLVSLEIRLRRREEYRRGRDSA
jgi:hypothetical protein